VTDVLTEVVKCQTKKGDIRGTLADAAEITNVWKRDSLHSEISLKQMRGDISMVRLLFDAGANLESRGPCGPTPLHLAASRGHVEVARLLLDSGADVNACDHFDATVLYYAISQSDGLSTATVVEIAKLLIDRGADWEARNEYANSSPKKFAREHRPEAFGEIDDYADKRRAGE